MYFKAEHILRLPQKSWENGYGMKRVWAIDGQLATLDCQEARTIQDSPGPFVHVLPCQYRRNTSFLLPDKINLGGRVCGGSCLSMQSAAVENVWRKSLRRLVALCPQQGNREMDAGTQIFSSPHFDPVSDSSSWKSSVHIQGSLEMLLQKQPGILSPGSSESFQSHNQYLPALIYPLST